MLTAPWFAGLRALTMSYANLADVDLAALAGVDFRKLESLNLGSNLFGDAGVAALCDGPAWPALTTLILYGRTGDLADVPLPGPAAAAALAASGRFPKLTKLDLRDVPIGQEGAEALARSKRMTGLTSLCVTAAAVGPAGMSALEKRFGEAVEPY